MTDTGFLAALIGANQRRILDDATLQGTLFETFVCIELHAQSTWSETDLSGIFHYRDQDRREIDLVLEATDGSIVCVEVKSSATVDSADFRHLIWMREKRNDIFRAGVVIYTGDETRTFGDRLIAVPLCGLWS